MINLIRVLFPPLIFVAISVQFSLSCEYFNVNFLTATLSSALTVILVEGQITVLSTGIIETIIGDFKSSSINNITPADVRRWQNELISQNYSQTYIKTIHNQLSAIFNYAIRYHNLSKNPAKEAGSVGKKKADRVSFWTAEEFNKAIKYINEYDYVSKISLEILFWTGMRQGELYALTPQDINFKNNTISI